MGREATRFLGFSRFETKITSEEKSLAYQVRPLLDNCGLGGDRPGQLADLLKHLQYYWILPQGPPKVLVSSRVQDFSAPLSQGLTRKSLGCPTLSPGALDL